VKITASNLVDLESAWCEKMGGSPRGGPAFSGLENSNFRGFLRSITEGFKGFTAKGGSLKRLWDSSGPQSSRAARWEKETCFNVVHGAAFKILPVDPNLVLRLAGAHYRFSHDENPAVAVANKVLAKMEATNQDVQVRCVH